MVRFISEQDISNLKISNEECLAWVQEALVEKEFAYLPAKESIKPSKDVFFTSMPCLLKKEQVYGLKMVSRIPGRIPALDSDLLLYNAETGELKAFIEADWITSMRTGAVAAYSILELAPESYSNISCIGLGNTFRATLDILLPLITKPLTIRLRKYKDQAEKAIERYKQFDNIHFEIIDNDEAFFREADVVLSCVTCCDGNMAKDEWFKENVLVVPVHTLGFQNCDLFFDRVVIDDYEHTKKFKYFNEFKNLTELKDVKNLTENDKVGRILVYNVGIALHDVYFASKIVERIEQNKNM